VLKSKGQNSSNEIDLVPILGRPQEQDQLGNYLYTVGANDYPVFKLNDLEDPIDLIECSATSDQNDVFVDLNGPMLSSLIEKHNGWIKTVTGLITALTDVSSNEQGVACLNCNIVTNHLNYIYTPSTTNNINTVVPKVDEKGQKIVRSAIPHHRRRRGMARPKVVDEKVVIAARLNRVNSKVKMPKSSGLKYEPTRVGAFPDTDSTYFRDNVGLVKCSSTFPFLSATWKYQSFMIKPIFWVTVNQNQGCYKAYQSWQIQPHTLPIASKTPLYTISVGQLAMPSLFDSHLNMANMDIKGPNSVTLSEMEIDFDEFERSGEGGFFAEVGKMIGGWIDTI